MAVINKRRVYILIYLTQHLSAWKVPNHIIQYPLCHPCQNTAASETGSEQQKGMLLTKTQRKISFSFFFFLKQLWAFNVNTKQLESNFYFIPKRRHSHKVPSLSLLCFQEEEELSCDSKVAFAGMQTEISYLKPLMPKLSRIRITALLLIPTATLRGITSNIYSTMFTFRNCNGPNLCKHAEQDFPNVTVPKHSDLAPTSNC